MIEHAINIVFIKLSSVLKPHSPPKKQWILQKCFLYKRGNPFVKKERRKREGKKKKELAYKAAPIYVLAVPLK